MRLQLLIIFTLVIVGAIAHRRDDQRRWRRRPVEENEQSENHLSLEGKEASSSSSEVDAVPEDPQTQNERVHCRHGHRRHGGRRHFNRNNETGGENENKNHPEGIETTNEHDGQRNCTRRFRNRHRHHERHEAAEGEEGHQKHTPEWHQNHNIPMPDGDLKHYRHREHNVTMPGVDGHHHRCRPHHHRHHHHHHHHNRTTTPTTTPPSPVERSTWNVNEEK